MNLITEFISIIGQCLQYFSTDLKNNGQLLLVILLIIAASIFMGWLVNNCTKLWNKQAISSLFQKIASLLTLLLTAFFIVLFLSLNYLQDVCLKQIDSWKTQLENNQTWSSETFATTYYAIKALNVEDFSSSPPPEKGGRTMPANQEISRRTTGKIYVAQAIKEFTQSHPYLSLLLQADLAIPEQKIYESQNKFFESHAGATYNLKDAIEIAVQELKQGLEKRIPPLVMTTKIIIIVGYIMLLIVAFTIIGINAYRNIKVFR